MTHLDLFSGIGGFALAADRVWPGIEHTFVEYDPFCQAILKKHYPNSTIHGDIRTFIADTEREGREGELRDTEGQHRLRDRSGGDEKPFILTGGFPCQPFSVAGRRKGTDDHRYLWPEMFRVIQLYKPTWVIAENVRGLTTWNEGMVLETVCSDLESEGYEVQPFIIPACAVGAPHRRERVWIVAHRNVLGNGAGLGSVQEANGEVPERHDHAEPCDTNHDSTSHPRCERREQGGEGQSKRSSVHSSGQSSAKWNRDWREVALATCNDREHDGFSDWLYSITRNEELAYATSDHTITRQKMFDLWQAVQSPKVWEAFRRCFKVREAEVLYETLRQFSTEPENMVQRPQEGSTSFEEDMLRGLWSEWKVTSSPQRRRYIEQYRSQCTNLVPKLPLEASLAAAEAWDCIRFIRQALTPQGAEMDGVTISGARHRKERLKACGNAIVPQVAEEIMRAMVAP